MFLKLSTLASVAILLASVSGASASPIAITSVLFTGSSANPGIMISGSGFGIAPVATSVAATGYTGLDYGTALHVTDASTIPLFDAGYDDPANGYHDTIGLTDLNYSDTSISFHLGGVYLTYPVKFNAGDTYTVHVADSSYSGLVNYQQVAPTPEPSALLLLATGLTLLLPMRHLALVRSSVQL